MANAKKAPAVAQTATPALDINALVAEAVAKALAGAAKAETPAAKAKPAAKASAPAMQLDFSCLRQTGATRQSSSGKTVLVPVMGKLPNGTVIGGTLWVK